jgi:uncharacterized protein YdhG (YjbR/CyaY superfamily)
MNSCQFKLQPTDVYIAQFPDDIQGLLTKIRLTIKSVAPDAQEKISYQIPTFYLNGNLVHFAAWQKHIGFYPGESGIAAFKQELAMYKNAKGSVQFPYNQPIPFDLIAKIVQFRVSENMKKSTRPKRAV